MYSGTIVPLVTPLDDNGIVSKRCVGRLIESVREHVTALMPALSSGEGWVLSDEQWRHVVAAAQAHCHGVPVLAGILLPDTSAVIRRARHAVALDVDAIVVSAPFGAAITQEEIYRHYAAIRAATEIPLFVYNETAISGNHIELATLARICQLPDVVGIKDSSGWPELTRSIVETIPEVPVFQGWEHLLLDVPGVAGFIGPLANLDPVLCNQMLGAPTARLQADITEAVKRYGLVAEDWYRPVKTELLRRGILTTDRVAAPPGCDPMRAGAPRSPASRVVTDPRLPLSPATLVIFSDLNCSFAHLAVYRLHQTRSRLGLEGQLWFEHRAFPLELFNRNVNERPGVDSEAAVLGGLEPGAGWQLWQGPDWTYPVTTLLALEAVQAATDQSWHAGEQLDRALRRGFWAESRCIAQRHVILDIAATTGAVDVDRLAAALDTGSARTAVMAQFRAASGGRVTCSPHIFLYDGTNLANPGIRVRWQNGGFGVGFPVIEADDPRVYENLLTRATELAAIHRSTEGRLGPPGNPDHAIDREKGGMRHGNGNAGM